MGGFTGSDVWHRELGTHPLVKREPMVKLEPNTFQDGQNVASPTGASALLKSSLMTQMRRPNLVLSLNDPVIKSEEPEDPCPHVKSEHRHSATPPATPTGNPYGVSPRPHRSRAWAPYDVPLPALERPKFMGVRGRLPWKGLGTWYAPDSKHAPKYVKGTPDYKARPKKRRVGKPGRPKLQDPSWNPNGTGYSMVQR